MAENKSSEADVSSDEEVEEPKLKYERLSNDVLTILSKDSASCIAVNDKLVVIGSHWGKLYVLDHKGNNVSNKEVQAHAVSVNQISLDSKGDYVASCSDDGRVIVYGLYSSDNAHTLTFERPIKSVALDPEYYRPNSRRRFLIGDDKLTLFEKTFLRGHKSTILHSGEGVVSNIKWSGRYIAWATDVGVRVFDMLDNCTISLIKKDCADRNLDYKCHLCWATDSTLLIGWGDTMKTCQIRKRPNVNQNYNLPVQYVEITKMAKSDFQICGIGPIDNHVAVLSLPKSSNEEHPRPQLKVLELFLKEYSDISTDILSIRGHTEYSVKDYHLECLCNEGLFFIVSPKDIVVAKPRDNDDHIDWLLETQKYEEALIAATQDKGTLQRHTVVDVGRKYIQMLLSGEEYEKAARLCVQVLGKEKSLWETEVYRFAHLNQLRTLSPYLPRGEFHLSSAIYEMVLFEFLKLDSEGFLNTVKEWSPKLYSVSGLVNALLEELLAQPDNEVLLQALAQLYSYQNKHDKALAIYLKLGHKDVFELIHKHRLLTSIHDKLEGLMILDLEQAVKLYLEHIDLIPVPLVVAKLKNNPKFLFAYLDALVAKDSKGTLSGKYHGLLVGLYAVQAPHRLLAFLQSSSSYPLQGALEVCQQHSLHHECVYLLGRIHSW